MELLALKTSVPFAAGLGSELALESVLVLVLESGSELVLGLESALVL